MKQVTFLPMRTVNNPESKNPSTEKQEVEKPKQNAFGLLRVCKGSEQPKKKAAKKKDAGYSDEVITNFDYLKIKRASDFEPDPEQLALYEQLPYEFKSYFPKTHPELALLIQISNSL